LAGDAPTREGCALGKELWSKDKGGKGGGVVKKALKKRRYKDD